MVEEVLCCWLLGWLDAVRVKGGRGRLCEIETELQEYSIIDVKKGVITIARFHTLLLLRKATMSLLPKRRLGHPMPVRPTTRKFEATLQLLPATRAKCRIHCLMTHAVLLRDMCTCWVYRGAKTIDGVAIILRLGYALRSRA